MNGEYKPTASDYEEVLTGHRRLVRELDVLLNGSGAAKQASLCDIVGQVRDVVERAGGKPLLSDFLVIRDLQNRVKELEVDSHAPVDLRPAIQEEVARQLFDKP